MKIKGILLAFLLLSAGFSHAQQTSLVGTWKLVSGKATVNDTITNYDLTLIESMKIITPTHFAVMRKNAEGTTLGFGGGRVKMDDTNYTEILDYATSKNLLNKNVVFTYKIDGKRCHMAGGTEGYRFDEVWEKVQ